MSGRLATFLLMLVFCQFTFGAPSNLAILDSLARPRAIVSCGDVFQQNPSGLISRADTSSDINDFYLRIRTPGVSGVDRQMFSLVSNIRTIEPVQRENLTVQLNGIFSDLKDRNVDSFGFSLKGAAKIEEFLRVSEEKIKERNELEKKVSSSSSEDRLAIGISAAIILVSAVSLGLNHQPAIALTFGTLAAMDLTTRALRMATRALEIENSLLATNLYWAQLKLSLSEKNRSSLGYLSFHNRVTSNYAVALTSQSNDLEPYLDSCWLQNSAQCNADKKTLENYLKKSGLAIGAADVWLDQMFFWNDAGEPVLTFVVRVLAEIDKTETGSQIPVERPRIPFPTFVRPGWANP